MAIPTRHASSENVVANNRTFFATSSIAGKRNLLQSDRSARLFIRVLYGYRAQGKFRVHEFVVMPDHFHLLITIEASMTIEHAVQFIKGGFAFRAGKEFGMRAPVWQKGFYDARVWNSQQYERLREYIHDNPVKRGLVLQPDLFPYSSATGLFELDPRPQGLKPADFVDLIDTAKAVC
jgi:putative transposase